MLPTSGSLSSVCTTLGPGYHCTCPSANARLPPFPCRAENRLAQYGQVLAELRGYAVEASEALAQHEQARERAAAEVEMTQRELTDYAEQRFRRFFIDLMALVGERGKREHLVELAIDYPTRLLPEDLAVVQVPGVMEGDAKEEEQAWAVIREEADGCILVSELESGVSMRAKRFLQQIREVVPRVLLVRVLL